MTMKIIIIIKWGIIRKTPVTKTATTIMIMVIMSIIVKKNNNKITKFFQIPLVLNYVINL